MLPITRTGEWTAANDWSEEASCDSSGEFQSAESLVRWCLGPGRSAVEGRRSPLPKRSGGTTGGDGLSDLLVRYGDAMRTLNLSPRRLDLLRMAYELELNDREIAERLKVSRRTICRERRKALREVSLQAMRRGLLRAFAA